MPTNLAEVANAITAEWQAAWNSHDMSRMARLVTSDADWVTVGGKHLRGASEIEAVHVALHTSQLRSSVWANQTFTVRPLGPGAALLHLSWSVQGDVEADGTPRKPRNGILTWVLVANEGKWLIRAAHGTNIVAT